MSFKASLLKTVVKWTPNKLVIWVANIVLKGIAQVEELHIDLDDRKVYVQTTLHGETDIIEIWINDFYIDKKGNNYQFFMAQAESNRPWLTNLLTRLVGKTWKIPVPNQYKEHFAIIAEVLEAKAEESTEISTINPS